MKKPLAIIHILIIVLLTIDCYESSGSDDERDSGVSKPNKTVKTDSGSGKEAGDSVPNECREEKALELDAIQDSCKAYVDCCYCGCEFTGIDYPDCDCTAWGGLVRDRDVTRCEGALLNVAITCLSDSADCINKARTIVTMRCGQ